jgi:uncharacterized protein affecting Mg2+/Co2+ transport
MNHHNLFQENDVVEISSSNPDLKIIWGRKGIVRGISQSEEEPFVFAYAIDIPAEKSNWFIYERDLKATGKKAHLNFVETDCVINVDQQGTIRDADED